MAYGFEAYRADSSVLIGSNDGVARLIYANEFSATHSGTITVSAFNSDQGYYVARMLPYIYTMSGGSATVEADSLAWTGSPNNNRVGYSPLYKPDLSWNNTTKVMTIAPSTETEYADRQMMKHKYRLFMVHYK